MISTGLLPHGIIEVAAAFKFQPITLRSCLGGELEFNQWFILVGLMRRGAFGWRTSCLDAFRYFSWTAVSTSSPR